MIFSLASIIQLSQRIVPLSLKRFRRSRCFSFMLLISTHQCQPPHPLDPITLALLPIPVTCTQILVPSLTIVGKLKKNQHPLLPHHYQDPLTNDADQRQCYYTLLLTRTLVLPYYLLDFLQEPQLILILENNSLKPMPYARNNKLSSIKDEINLPKLLPLQQLQRLQSEHLKRTSQYHNRLFRREK